MLRHKLRKDNGYGDGKACQEEHSRVIRLLVKVILGQTDHDACNCIKSTMKSAKIPSGFRAKDFAEVNIKLSADTDFHCRPNHSRDKYLTPWLKVTKRCTVRGGTRDD